MKYWRPSCVNDSNTTLGEKHLHNMNYVLCVAQVTYEYFLSNMYTSQFKAGNHIVWSVTQWRLHYNFDLS